MESNTALQRRDYFHIYLRQTYVAHISTLLRRTLSRNSQSISLLKLLDSVESEIKGSKSEVRADIADLEARALSCKDFFDKSVAHLDKIPPTTIPKYDEIHSTIDLLVAICQKYTLLLTGNKWAPDKREVGDEWLTIFDGAWYEP